MTQSMKARQFRMLHEGAPLFLPNAWDAASARIIERAGAQAIATTSGGMSWSMGRRDGQKLSRHEVVEAVRNITRTVSIPVSVDIEGGYGAGSAADVAQTVRDVIKAGAVGINIEDSPGDQGSPLIDVEGQLERIKAARAAAEDLDIELFVNARTDVYLASVGDPETRTDEVIRRAEAYTDAGANGIFVPGLADAGTIAALAKAIKTPLNIMAGPGSPTIPELSELGVARVSVGSALAQAAFQCTFDAVLELLGSGTYGALSRAFSFSDANEMFANV